MRSRQECPSEKPEASHANVEISLSVCILSMALTDLLAGTMISGILSQSAVWSETKHRSRPSINLWLLTTRDGTTIGLIFSRENNDLWSVAARNQTRNDLWTDNADRRLNREERAKHAQQDSYRRTRDSIAGFISHPHLDSLDLLSHPVSIMYKMSKSSVRFF